MLPASQPNLVVAMNSYVDVAMPMLNEFSASARNPDYTLGNCFGSSVLGIATSTYEFIATTRLDWETGSVLAEVAPLARCRLITVQPSS